MRTQRARGWTAWAFASTLLAGWTLVGCGGPKVLPEYPVSGSVTLDGNPLAEGDIYFRDDATSTMSVLTVKDGQFTGKSEAGKFKVEINSFREESAKTDSKTGYAPPGGTTKTNIIPPEFNANSKLTAEVTAAGPNQFKFEVKSK